MEEHKQIWIDAIEFEERGGWKLDSQFTHLMGNPYLLACEAPGQPVSDATTNVVLDKPGKFRIWVRTKNWYATHSPGQFQLKINGETSGIILGNLPTNDWYWHCAGDFDLKEGKNEICANDLTGYFARFAAILLTDDMDYVPPRPVNEFIAERAKIKQIDISPKEYGEYDIVVAGAGPGGIPAAIAAARKGKKTLLISNRPVIGGNSSREAGVGFNGASARQPNAREGGIGEEIIRTFALLRKNWQIEVQKELEALGIDYQPGPKFLQQLQQDGKLTEKIELLLKRSPSWTDALEMLCQAEPNLRVILNYHVCGADTENNRITGCTALNINDGTKIHIRGKMFIDCSGDGWLGYYAGAKYRLGREPKWMYNEDFAFQNPDNCTMSGCLFGNTKFTDTGKPVDFTAPDWVPVFAKGRDFGRNIERIGTVWWLEAPNVYDDIYDAEMARDELFRIILGYFNYLKNLWDKKERAANYVIESMPFYDAKRESRRFVGDYVLTQNDCVEGRDFDDKISHTGWPIDLHNPKGIYSGKEGPFFSNAHVPLVKVPYRCLYSKNIENLYFAGRCASVTHIALGTARIQNTIACMAQAAATAACMCIDKRETPRGIYERHIRELQQILLRDDQFIPGLKNEDPDDIARRASVTESSYKKDEIFTWHLGEEAELLPMDRKRATFFPRDTFTKIPYIWSKFYNDTDEPIEITIHLYDQQDPDGYLDDHEIAVSTATIAPKTEEWVKFDVDVTVELRYLWMWVDKTPGLYWKIYRMAPLDWTRSEWDETEKEFPNMRTQTHCVTLSEPVAKPANCKGENIINGYSRIHDEINYEWVSDPKESMPQWVELTLDKPQYINTICLTFDTDMNNPPMLHPMNANPERLITDYTVSVFDGEKWIDIVRQRGNHMRRRIHKFDRMYAEKVKITAEKTFGDPSARLFEVRIYND